MKSPTYYTAILYSRDGYEISRFEALEGMKRAKEQARHMLSDPFATSSETTHERLQTMKAAIFKDGEETGANTICEWDNEHPQHRAFREAEHARYMGEA
jgi:hypothetical protein